MEGFGRRPGTQRRDAFSRLQQAMGSAISTEVGEEGPKSVVELRNMASDKDRTSAVALRERVRLFEAYKIPCQCLNGVTGTTLTLSKEEVGLSARPLLARAWTARFSAPHHLHRDEPAPLPGPT